MGPHHLLHSASPSSHNLGEPTCPFFMEPAIGQGDHVDVPEEKRGNSSEVGRAAAGGGWRGRAAQGTWLTFCIRESISTMFFSTWSAFFCRRSMSSVSSLLEMLGRKRGRKSGTCHPTNTARALSGCCHGAVTSGVAGGQPSLPGTAAVCDSLPPF